MNTSSLKLLEYRTASLPYMLISSSHDSACSSCWEQSHDQWLANDIWPRTVKFGESVASTCPTLLRWQIACLFEYFSTDIVAQKMFSTSFWILKGFCGFPCGTTEEPQRIHINSLIRLLPPVSKNPASIHITIQNIIQNFELKAHMAWCLAHKQPLIMISLIVSLLPWKTQGTLSFTIFKVDGGQKAAREQRVKLIKVGRSV